MPSNCVMVDIWLSKAIYVKNVYWKASRSIKRAMKEKLQSMNSLYCYQCRVTSFELMLNILREDLKVYFMNTK